MILITMGRTHTITKSNFLNKLIENNESFRNNEFNVITEYITYQTKMLVESKYGLHLILASSLLKGVAPTIYSSTNKTRYIINRFKELYGEEYDYNKVNYVSNKDKVNIYCNRHNGYFLKRPNAHLFGQGCSKCGKKDRTDNLIKKAAKSFKKKARIIHGDRYDYTKTNYQGVDIKVIITCNEHGDFTQIPNGHLNGNGCQKCFTSFWKYSDWEKAGNKSVNFDSYKVYIIRCFNETEEFYKIGKTFSTVAKRFNRKDLMPYEYEVLKVIEGSARFISELENKLQNENKEHRYLPIKDFKGKTECFKKLKEI